MLELVVCIVLLMIVFIKVYEWAEEDERMSLILKNESRIDIYEEIEMERHYQDRTWGGPEHDDNHDVRDWVAYIVNYLGRTVNGDASWGRNLEVVKRYLIKVAALCVAAIESIDRKTRNNDVTPEPEDVESDWTGP